MTNYLSYSQISEWFACRFRHSLRYQYKLKPKTVSRAMDLGSFIHEGVAAALQWDADNKEHPKDLPYKPSVMAVDRIWDMYDSELLKISNDPEDVFAIAMRDQLKDVADTAVVIVQRLIDNLGLDHRVTIVHQSKRLIEQKMYAPLQGWDGYVGIFDWVMHDSDDGLTWLVDFKTRGTLQQDDAEETNLQTLSYLHILRENGIEVDGVMIYQVLSKVPAQPKLNKDGSMSRSKITSDWETYQDALLAENLDPSDYQDMEAKLDAQFFRETKLVFSETEIEKAWEQVIVPAAKDIASYQGPRYRSLSNYICRGCAYKEPCLASLRGHDVEDILDRQFTRG